MSRMRVVLRVIAAGFCLSGIARDALAASAQLLVDINPGAASSFPTLGLTLNSQVLFAASDASGYALWRSDGTTAGTVRVGRGAPIRGVLGPTAVQLGNLVVYTASDSSDKAQVWSTDGTAAGTQLLQDLTVQAGFGALDVNPITCGGIVVLGNRAFYGALGSLYRTDGTVAGSIKLDVTPAGAVCALAAFGGSVYFTVQNSITGVDALLRTTGEPGVYEPVLTADGRPMRGPLQMQEMGSNLYFFAQMDRQVGLWRLTPGDPFAHLQVTKFWSTDSGLPALNGTLDNVLLFRDYYQPSISQSPNLIYLHSTDGTTAGTRMLSPVQSAPSPRTFGVRLGNRFFYTGPAEAAGIPLYVTDGTSAGTTSFRLPLAQSQDSRWPEFVALDGKVYFTLMQSDAGMLRSKLWRTDGTAGGTSQVEGLPFIARYSNQVHLGVAAGRLVFPAESDQYGLEPWFYDPNSTSTPGGSAAGGGGGGSGGGGNIVWLDAVGLALLVMLRRAASRAIST